MSHLIAPSVLASDFGKLDEEIEMLNTSSADWIHIDIMDGHFVPNISFGFPVLKAMASKALKPMDIHLMINNPEHYIDRFAAFKPYVISVHYEACQHLHSTLSHIKKQGVLAGIAINPHTNVTLLEDVLELVDLICVMSVNPGFGGQEFIYQTLPKVQKLKEMCIVRNLSPYIEIDGGVGLHNAEALLKAGANVLVAGSSVFKSEKPQKTIHQFKEIGKQSLWV